MDPENQRVAVAQEWESFRYQDGLRWSKIQTLLAVEAALLAGIYSAPSNVTVLMQLILAIVGTVIVCAICSLAEKDGRDAKYHMQRAETLLPLATTVNVAMPKKVLGIGGTNTLRAAMLLLIGLNVVVVVEVLSRWECSLN